MLIECKEFDGGLWVPIDRVSQTISMAVENEREACAKVCESFKTGNSATYIDDDWADMCADAIRARSKTNWPFPTADKPAIPWTAKQIQEYSKKQREDAGEALW